MRKIKQLLFIATLCIISLTSCSDNDTTPEIAPPTLEGKWQVLKTGEVINNQEVLTNYTHVAGCTKAYLEILPSNILKDHNFENPNCLETIQTGNWTRNNNFMDITFANSPMFRTEILELTYSTLKFKIESSGIVFLVVFSRL